MLFVCEWMFVLSGHCGELEDLMLCAYSDIHYHKYVCIRQTHADLDFVSDGEA